MQSMFNVCLSGHNLSDQESLFHHISRVFHYLKSCNLGSSSSRGWVHLQAALVRIEPYPLWYRPFSSICVRTLKDCGLHMEKFGGIDYEKIQKMYGKCSKDWGATTPSPQPHPTPLICHFLVNVTDYIIWYNINPFIFQWLNKSFGSMFVLSIVHLSQQPCHMMRVFVHGITIIIH